jgi:Na+-translocating ferredoxin:NAD+ oxidoreductase subunit D
VNREPAGVRQFPTAAAPHLPAARSVRRIMALVLLALLPTVAAHVWFFGIGLLLQIALAVAFALLFEALMLRLRRQPLLPFLGDGSAPLAAVLFALCLPPLAPWWIALLGMAAAMVLAKHLYGGLGHNLFNPAMVGFAVVLISFPLELSQWPAARGGDIAPPGALESVRAVFGGVAPRGDWDAITEATPLDATRTLGAGGASLSEIRQAPAFGRIGGRGVEWIALAAALGGIVLVALRVIPWQTPLALLGTVVALSGLLHLFEPDLHPGPLQHLATGALVLAAFFIATDPVTGCTTPRGRLVFAAGVAVLTLAIRRWGNYPDGVAFAILLMNCAAPWIDLHTRPRIYGEARR